MNLRDKLSDCGRKLAETAEGWMDGVELEVYPSPYCGEHGRTRRMSLRDKKWIRVEVETNDEYDKTNGGGDADYYLAHDSASMRTTSRADSRLSSTTIL